MSATKTTEAPLLLCAVMATVLSEDDQLDRESIAAMYSDAQRALALVGTGMDVEHGPGGIYESVCGPLRKQYGADVVDETAVDVVTEAVWRSVHLGVCLAYAVLEGGRR